MSAFFKILKYKFNIIFGRTESPKTLGTNKPLKWYGRVNFWGNMSETKKDIKACVKYGVDGYMIELAGWAVDSNNVWNDAWYKDIEKKYKEIVKLVRAAGIWLFVSVVNDNMGHGKYGDKAPKLEKVLPLAQKLVQLVKSQGNKNIVVQPVAETQTSAGKQFDNYCKANLPNFTLVYNGDGGRPNSRNGMNYRAWHPASVSTSCPYDSFAVSDHGLIIKELANGTYDGPCNKERVQTWYNNIKKWGCPVMGYYAFLRREHDAETIKTIGRL